MPRASIFASRLPGSFVSDPVGRARLQLEGMLYEPRTTPEQWCQLRPCVSVGGAILNEPLGSFLVFLLAFLWIGSGVYFLRNHQAQSSRKWLGVALVLEDMVAQAGISYQAFSYALKCAGKEFCTLTNGFEVGYSVTQAVSVSCMLTAVAIACTSGWFRKALIVYCILNAAVYVLITIAGVTQPNQTLLSFEVLMLFALPGILFVMLVSGVQYARKRKPLDGSLLGAAVLLVLVNAAYFAYYGAGITALLYRAGEDLLLRKRCAACGDDLLACVRCKDRGQTSQGFRQRGQTKRANTAPCCRPAVRQLEAALRSNRW